MIEIERKFLVKKGEWSPKGKAKSIRQGYLAITPKSVVRVRIADNQAFITIKGARSGISRTELEYEIPVTEADILMNMCLYPPVEKQRFYEKVGKVVWEIDVFSGVNEGLVLAEVELKSENQHLQIPAWIDREVSDDYRYYNSWLSQHPFKTWK